jgi:hypothetical protein
MSTALATAEVPITRARTDVPVAPAYGRFSTGMGRTPETSQALRVGSFADGVQQSYDSSMTERVGHFSTGMERTPETPQALRVGSFADGYERTPWR